MGSRANAKGKNDKTLAAQTNSYEFQGGKNKHLGETGVFPATKEQKKRGSCLTTKHDTSCPASSTVVPCVSNPWGKEKKKELGNGRNNQEDPPPQKPQNASSRSARESLEKADEWGKGGRKPQQLS